MIKVELVYDFGDENVIITYQGRFYLIDRDKMTHISGPFYHVDPNELVNEIDMKP